MNRLVQFGPEYFLMAVILSKIIPRDYRVSVRCINFG